jgi:hypothetical protein
MLRAGDLSPVNADVGEIKPGSFATLRMTAGGRAKLGAGEGLPAAAA